MSALRNCMRIGCQATLALAASASPLCAEIDAVEQVVVTATAPTDTQSLDTVQVTALGNRTIVDSLNKNVPAAFLSDTVANPFQPDLYFRGFDASPVLGTSQGLAVFQNGDRVNEAFGDTVLWDLVPTFAVRKLAVIPGSDAILGLNALGGAVSIELKSGFDMTGYQLDLQGGSFGRTNATVQFGQAWSSDAVYVGVSLGHDDGWRQSSASGLAQAYADVAIRRNNVDADIGLTLATDRLSENAAIPIQDSRTAAFSIPDIAKDTLAFLQARLSADLEDGWSIRTHAYLRADSITTSNGQASGFEPCPATPAQLCNDTTPLFTTSGEPIPSSSGGSGTIGIDKTATLAAGVGLSTGWSGTLLSMVNTFDDGFTLETARSHFSTFSELGNLEFLPGGDTVVSDGIRVGGPVWNVGLKTTNDRVSVFAADSVSPTQSLSIRVAAQLYQDRIEMRDGLGTALDGNHAYSGFNPSAGITWQPGSDASIHLSWGRSSRTPTAAELSCANAFSPCLFPLSFISDPGLKQVTAETFDAGAEKSFDLGDVKLETRGAVYDTINRDDIFFISDGPILNSGYFRNVGRTERRGAELGIKLSDEKLSVSVNYGYIEANFRSGFVERSPFNPAADAFGNITVSSGDRIPAIPRQTLKSTVEYQLLPRIRIEIETQASSSTFLRGDEANLTAPLPGFVTVGAGLDYAVSATSVLTLKAENLLNARASTFGLYGDPTGNGALPQFTNPRFIVPNPPFGLWGALSTRW